MSQGDDDFELLKSRPFFGWEEAKRDEVMGRAVYQQAANLRAIKATQAADAARMRAELSKLSGSVENRLGALTRSFGAFVELDAVRQQLAAFPEHARARRLALNDLSALRAGQAPPERPDIEGYWLPPAVAALRPAGGIDQAKAAVALQRDPAAALFLLVARAVLGAGPEVAADVVRLLASTSGEWDETQQRLWGIVVAGGFGPRALGSLLSTLQPTIGAEQGWDEWLGSLARPGGRTLEQVNIQLGKVLGVEPPLGTVGPEVTATEETAGAAPASRDVDVVADAAAEPRPGAEIPLLELATQLIEEGDSGERALLERVELLRLQIANPGDDIADLPLGVPPRRIVDLVRELAVDAAADGAARRQAWRALLEPIDRWVAAVGEPAPPHQPEVKVIGQSFMARPDGVDPGELRRAERAIAKEGEPSVWSRRAPLLLWGGVSVAVLGVVLIALTGQWGFFLLVVLGGIGVGLGFRLGKDGTERVERAEGLRRSLAREVEGATRRAASEYDAAQAGYAARVGDLASYRALRRQIG